LQVTGRFRVDNAAGTHQGIRGYEVWLSIGNDQNFKKVISYNNYAGLTSTGSFGTAPGGNINFIDRNPTITPDVPHYYKIRVWNGNPADSGNGPGFSLWSDTLVTTPLQPFTTTADDVTHTQKLWPTFRFNITNPGMFNDPDMTDFAFLLYLKPSDGNYPFFYAPFQIDFTERDEDDAWGVGKPSVWIQDVQDYSGSTGVATGPLLPAADYIYGPDGETIVAAAPFAWLENDGTVVVNTDSPKFRELVRRNQATLYFNLLYGNSLEPGAAYQWSIFGLGGGIIGGAVGGISGVGTDAALFAKGRNLAPYDQQPRAFSFGSNRRYSYGSPNGFYRLIIDPNAK